MVVTEIFSVNERITRYLRKRSIVDILFPFKEAKLKFIVSTIYLANNIFYVILKILVYGV